MEIIKTIYLILQNIPHSFCNITIIYLDIDVDLSEIFAVGLNIKKIDGIFCIRNTMPIQATSVIKI